MNGLSRRWSLGAEESLDVSGFVVAGIVNVTPDSFYDGGKSFAPGKAISRARSLLRQGAGIIDLGGESTRPGAGRVSPEEETQRLLPVLRELCRARPGRPLPLVSVDTRNSATAQAALQAGARIINDVSACAHDPGLLDVLGEYKPGYVLMHSQGEPGTMQNNPVYSDVLSEIARFFELKLKQLSQAGLPESRVVLDPGIGFGKTLEHNLTILKHIEWFKSFGLPLYVGLSNKSMFERLLGLKLGQRGPATQVAVALLAKKGVALHRVHDVAATRRTLRLVEEIG